MNDEGLGRRDFLKGAVVGGAAAATATPAILPDAAQAQQAGAPAATGYAYFNLDEAGRAARRPPPATRTSISTKRRSWRRWSITWCPPTSSRPRAPTSASTSTSIARSPAAGARATASTCRGRGPWVRPTRATRPRSRRPSFIASASSARMPIAAKPSGRIFTPARRSRRRCFSRTWPTARSHSRAACPAVCSSACSTKT